ncbi:MAG TPA: HTTM domain-containing protein, partial [Burkholderiales bacterium]
ALRVMFGVIMLVECWRFWSKGWIERHYIAPEFFFKYYGFEWVQAWPGDGMYWHFAALAVLALLITLGVFYRAATVLFFLAFTYIFLLDQARYLNHFYLVILISVALMVIPAPHLRSPTPAWAIWLFRLQFEVMYIYAGIVKVNADWLRLEPMGMWLARRDDFLLLGDLFQQDWVVAVASYGAIALHIIGAPLLLWKVTRGWVMVIYFAFHLMNHFMFNIGIFPWVAMAGTLIFLEPDWPRRAYRATKQFAFKIFRIRAPAHG